MSQQIKPKKFYAVKRPVPLTRRRRDFKFYQHECSEGCSALEQKLTKENPFRFKLTDDAILMYDQNPFLVPLYLEFKRKNEDKNDCGYLSPCGVELYSYEDIYRYLKISKSKLNINQFTLSARIELFRDHSFFEVYAMKRDISNGLEHTPIMAINEFKNEFWTPDFIYIKERRFSVDSYLLKNLLDDYDLKSCDCEDDCNDSNRCACRQLTIEENKLIDPINKAGYEWNYLLKQPKTAIYECNSKCKCKKNCLNRVVQNGIKVRLQVYKTAKKGFGVRVLHDVPRGTYICSYEGDIVQNRRSSLETDNLYLMNLSYAFCFEEFQNAIKNESQIKSNCVRNLNEFNNKNNEKLNQIVNPVGNEDKKKDKNEVHIQTNDLTYLSDLESSDNESTFSDLTNTDLSDSYSSINSSNEDNLDNLNDDEDNNFDEKSNDGSRKKLKKSDQSTDSDYLINSKEYGNVARFLNHSCNPNLECQPVFIETQNPIFTHFAFFTVKDLKAFTELTFNYFECEETDDGIRFECKCKSKKCNSKLKSSQKIEEE